MVKRLLQWFLHYGLMAAILVWAAAVGMMAYHLADSEWRWAFAALSVGGIATIGGILWIRTYIDRLTEASQKGNES
ncbi:MAG: hypothetical protein EXR97_02965 [Nitrospiraceae bacterium]|nr:hypothetical protein [Nitrospiraceae bacterium]MSR24828.1 hypothetical protein [Nitrospiraceae bacterium]